MRIGIIGGGPAGCAAAVALGSTARTADAVVDLTLIERQPAGGGRAFSQGNPALTLNTSAGVTSVDADDANGFVRFLNRSRRADPAEFAPRSEAADYLQATLDAMDGRHCRVRHVQAPASRVWSMPDDLLSIPLEGEQPTFDAVVVATGAPFRSLPFTPAGGCRSPYRLQGRDDLAPDAPVVVVGSSLSAVDACVSLHASGHRGPVLLLSSSGRLPAVRRSLLHDPAGRELEADVARRSSTQGTSELSVLGEVLRERVEDSATTALRGGRVGDGSEEFLRAFDESAAGVTSWERLMMSTIDILNRNWRILPERERARFQRDVGNELNRYISAMSFENAHIIRSMVLSGRLRVLAGSLDHRGTLRRRDGTEVDVGTGGVIVNATGLAAPIEDPFVASLRRDRLVSSNNQGGIAVHPRTGRAHPRYPVYALGPVTKGSVYTTNFLYSSAWSARAMARAMFGVPAEQLGLAS